MTTNIAIHEAALRLIGVIAETQPASPEQGETARVRLNQMMAQWAAEDVQLGYFAQTLTTATCPIPDWAERGVISKHALDMLAVYPSAQASPDLLDDNKNGFAVIQRICLAQKLTPLDMRHLGAGEGGYGGGYNILTDSR